MHRQHRRHRLRAFIKRHRPGVGAEETAAQLAACAALWEQAGEGGSGRAWERRWRAFPRLLVVLVGTAAAGIAELRNRGYDTGHEQASAPNGLGACGGCDPGRGGIEFS
ncbi:hypothetical protein ACFVXG_30755 [Kitasatospora sp. NPDC058162]|uniref:hypothetical protein n=1 Tax=Kitasatospora sp. NPDC058162 TaxID=3346362 RepID=UPI0036DC6FCA